MARNKRKRIKIIILILVIFATAFTVLISPDQNKKEVPKDVQDIGGLPRQRISINSLGEVNVTIKNVGSDNINLSTVFVFVGGKQIVCKWDISEISPGDITTCNFDTISCHNQSIKVIAQRNFDERKCM